MARLVNNQFNSPIGLYSEQNINEVISRESQMLGNGAIGINFQNPAAGKPSNLQNSAVLRMLEEEESRQRGFQNGNGLARPLAENIKWPPPEYEQRNRRTSFKDVVVPGVKRVAWPPPCEEGYTEQAAVQTQGGPQYSSQQSPIAHQPNNAPVQQQQQPSRRYPLQPLDISNGTSFGSQTSSISPVPNQSPQYGPPAAQQYQPPQQHYQPPQQQYQPPQQQYQAPQQQYQPPQQQYQAPQQHYQPPQQQYQPPQQQYQPPQQQYQPPQQQYQPPQQQYQVPQQQYQSPPQQYQPPQPQLNQQYSQPGATPSQVVPKPSVKQVEPPATTITLRQQAPVSQAPPPVVTSQPATATLKGGKNLRGDLKWPPEKERRQADEENRLRMELAQGPVCKPRLVKKDYGPFFAQHALNASYPGYKIPPGTQFYEHRPVY